MEPTIIQPPIITAGADYFDVNGVRYTRTDDISVTRYRVLQKWELEYGFDASFRAVWDATTQIKEAIDQRKAISDIAFINEGLRRGMANVDRGILFPLCAVSLWYNAPGEDASTYNHAANTEKMNRWEAAGLGMGFFFTKASSCVRGFRQAWLQLLEQTAALPPDPLPSPISPAS